MVAKYLGDPAFEPVWKELNDHNAVVFIHPTMVKGSKLASVMVQPPAFDFAHETGRTAAHMTVTGMNKRYPKCNIILSHAGGPLHILSERLAQLESNLFVGTLGADSPKTADEILADAKSLYFDLALGGTSNMLGSVVEMGTARAHPLRLGLSICIAEAEYNTRKMEEYDMPAEDREKYCVGNGLNLFPWLTG